MMKSITNVYLVLFMSLLITGCSSRTKAFSQVDENFRTGSQGLTFKFMPFSPPDKIFDNEELRFRIEISNKGAEDVVGTNNRAYVSGFDTSIITGIPTNGVEIPELEGKKVFNPDGSFDNVELLGFIRDLRARNIDKYQPAVLATFCYKYKTIADPNICVDPDPFSTTVSNKVCNFQTQPSLGTQGAPVAINRVDVEAAPGKTRFKIYVQNVGSGDVLHDGADILDRCNPYDPKGLDVNDIDFVHIDEVVLGDISIIGSCKPLDNGYLRLKTSGAGFMMCEVDGLIGPAYTTPLRITVSYNYRETLTTNLNIIQTP